MAITRNGAAATGVPASTSTTRTWEWGWSDEFPGLGGVFEDCRDPNPRLQSWLSGWDYWRVEVDEYFEIGDHVLAFTTYHGRGQGQRRGALPAGGARLSAARRQGRAARDLREPGKTESMFPMFARLSPFRRFPDRRSLGIAAQPTLASYGRAETARRSTTATARARSAVQPRLSSSCQPAWKPGAKAPSIITRAGP